MKINIDVKFPLAKSVCVTNLDHGAVFNFDNGESYGVRIRGGWIICCDEAVAYVDREVGNGAFKHVTPRPDLTATLTIS